MKKYETKVLTRNELCVDYKSFAILEGQTGLPASVQEAKDVLDYLGCEYWVLENLFEYPERIQAIPYLNPDVIIFQTTLMSKTEIDRFIKFLQSKKYKPKQIWQLIRNDIPLVDSDQYEVFSFYPDASKNTIEITKI